MVHSTSMERRFWRPLASERELLGGIRLRWVSEEKPCSSWNVPKQRLAHLGHRLGQQMLSGLALAALLH